MKQIITILFFCCLHLLCVAQDSKGNAYYFGDNFHFEGISTDKRMMARQSTTFQTSDKRIWRIFESLDNSKLLPGKGLDNQPKSPIILGIKLNPKIKNFFSAEVQNFSKFYNSYLIPDSSSAIIVAMGINESNINHYHYRVVENDSIELVKWSPIPKLEMKYGAKMPYGSIGTFNYPNKQILVEVANKNNHSVRDGYIIDWRRKYKPKLQQILCRGKGKYGYYNLQYDSLNNGYASKFDQITGVPLDWTFPKDSVTDFTLYFENHETIPYSIYLIKKINGKSDTSRIEWWFQEEQYTIANQYLSEIGKYEVLIHKTGDLNESPENEILKIFYTITEPVLPEKKYSLKALLPYILGLIGLIISLFLIYRNQNRNKIKNIEQQKQQIGMQLKNIQVQLNPHFMFNAINSIQNLIHKQNVEGANHYLNRFASLTRSALEHADQEMISLTDEIKLLDDYLQMEQLRFGFLFEIKNNLNTHTDLIEIPTMLLQPFAENAIKHGIAELYVDGILKIEFTQKQKNLLISILDNGKGFKYNHKIIYQGYGLRLSQERIDLFNKIYSDTPFLLKINSGENGTRITIEIQNWIANN